MSTCLRCGKEVSGIGSLLSFNRQTGRCSNCEAEVRMAQSNFRRYFLEFCRDGVLSSEEWNQLTNLAAASRLELNEALTYIRGDALNLLERNLTFAAADGIITDDEESDFNCLRQMLAIPDTLAKPLLDRLNYLKYVTRLRRGLLPAIIPSAGTHLESDEICHLEAPTRYHKINPKSESLVEGRLLLTNKKMRFLSPTGGFEIPWKNIMRVERQTGAVYLELATRRGNGRYDVWDPVAVEAMIESLVRISKRQLVMVSDDVASRHIPHEVKIAVWQRDQGKCVQCGANSYLEFDHIIPHSKGGASTLGNVQLLCRRCNLAKSDQI